MGWRAKRTPSKHVGVLICLSRVWRENTTNYVNGLASTSSLGVDLTWLILRGPGRQIAPLSTVSIPRPISIGITIPQDEAPVTLCSSYQVPAISLEYEVLAGDGDQDQSHPCKKRAALGGPAATSHLLCPSAPLGTLRSGLGIDTCTCLPRLCTFQLCAWVALSVLRCLCAPGGSL